MVVVRDELQHSAALPTSLGDLAVCDQVVEAVHAFAAFRTDCGLLTGLEDDTECVTCRHDLWSV